MNPTKEEKFLSILLISGRTENKATKDLDMFFAFCRWQELIVFVMNGEFDEEKLLAELQKTLRVHTLGSLSKGKINQPLFRLGEQTH